MKIRVKAEKLLSLDFNHEKFGAEIEFECAPRNYGELSERFKQAWNIVNQQIDLAFEEAERRREPIKFNDDEEVPF